MSSARAHRNDVIANSSTPTRSGASRPMRSLSGPATNCPRARPTIETEIVSCAAASVVPRDRAMSGRAGR